jgi:hypothetical protein
MAVQAWKTIIAQKEKGDPKAPQSTDEIRSLGQTHRRLL